MRFFYAFLARSAAVLMARLRFPAKMAVISAAFLLPVICLLLAYGASSATTWRLSPRSARG